MNRKISIAPMMNYTDRHERYFLRLIAPNVLLYTEMVTTGALIYGDYHRFLQFDPSEHPIALQLGGSEPDKLAYGARLGADFGYDEINLNVGCPSDRVKSGRFGACLMLSPTLVAECISAMAQSVTIPITVKCRIGVDEQDSYESLKQFIRIIADAGCEVFIIHARKAWLNGLSPKQNREIPPLRYDFVHQIKQDFPKLTIILNGGVTKLADVDEHLCHVDGVMIGREAYSHPFFLAAIDNKYYPATDNSLSRYEIVEKFIPYIEQQLNNKVKLSNITRHILGLFQGEKGARIWRRYISEHAHKDGATIEIITEALKHVRYAYDNL